MNKFRIIKSLIKNNPIIVEIGAHYGEDSARFLKVFTGITLHCIEPDPRNIQAIRKYLNDPRMKTHELAISNKDGEADFHLSYNKEITNKTLQKYGWISKEDYINLNLNSSGASSLKLGYPLHHKTVKVKTSRLDTWMRECKISRIDFLWIDVQGAEKEVIEGLGSAIIDFIWVEYGETEYEGSLTRKQTISLLVQKGYKLVKKHSSIGPKGDLLFQR